MTTVTAPTTTTAAATPAAGTKVAADFNMFLKLLTTQMQNQDPLKPMDSTAYTQQLAQFSQVEQTVQQTSTLKDILSRLTTQDLSQAAGLIGREGTFDTATSGLGDTAPAQWAYGSTAAATAVTATIADASGRIVATRAIDPSAAGGRFAWDGKLADGSRAPSGSYTLSLAATDAAGAAVTVAVNGVGTIRSVTGTGDAVKLGVNGLTIDKSKLVGVANVAG